MAKKKIESLPIPTTTCCLVNPFEKFEFDLDAAPCRVLVCRNFQSLKCDPEALLSSFNVL